MKQLPQVIFERELKKGSTELLILSLIEDRPRHIYEICKLIDEWSDGELKLLVANFYPLIRRLEARGYVQGRWAWVPGRRPRRNYQITARGKVAMTAQREAWSRFVIAVNQVMSHKNE